MKKELIMLDGAGGTRLWDMAEENGYGKEPVWKYNVEHPELVKRLAEEYIAAGSRIIYANTFGANGPAVARSSDYSVAQVVSAGVRIAKEAAAGSGVSVALDVGPLSVLMEPYGDLTEEEAEKIFRADRRGHDGKTGSDRAGDLHGSGDDEGGRGRCQGLRCAGSVHHDL